MHLSIKFGGIFGMNAILKDTKRNKIFLLHELDVENFIEDYEYPMDLIIYDVQDRYEVRL